MIDVEELAKEAIVVLSPALPYLSKGGEQALREASKKIGAAAYKKAAALWSRITSSSCEDGNEVEKAAKDVADNPSNSDADTILRHQIKKMLSEDKELFSDIEKLLNQKSITEYI